MLIQKSTEFYIHLNAKDKNGGSTAFHWACKLGKTRIVEMMIENFETFKKYQLLENFETFKIDLATKDNFGMTGVQIAKNHQKND